MSTVGGNQTDGYGFNDDERGISERGTSPSRFVRDPPILHAPTRPRAYSVQDREADLADQQREDAAKEQWKNDNPTWPFNSALRQESGFVFSDEEIRRGGLSWAALYPGLGGVLAFLFATTDELRQKLDTLSDDDFDDEIWYVVAQVAASIMFKLAQKKLKVNEAMKLLTDLFRKLGLDDKLALRAAQKLIWVQETAKKTFKKLEQDPRFRRLSASQKGTEWDAALKQALIDESKYTNRRNGFWFTTDVPVALGSGRHHEGPNIDLFFMYQDKALFWIDFKLSTSAISPHRTQTFMMVHDSLTQNALYFYMTPEHFVLLPGVGGGMPVSVEIVEEVFEQVTK